MNEYMKPDYEVMVFEANEYVAACEPVSGAILDLILDCLLPGDAPIKIRIDNGANGTWNTTLWVEGKDGEEGKFAGSGTLWENEPFWSTDPNKVDKTKPAYGFQGGDIHNSNHEHASTSLGNGEYHNGGGQSAGMKDCDCIFPSGSQANPHHHVIGWTNVGPTKNFS